MKTKSYFLANKELLFAEHQRSWALHLQCSQGLMFLVYAMDFSYVYVVASGQNMFLPKISITVWIIGEQLLLITLKVRKSAKYTIRNNVSGITCLRK